MRRKSRILEIALALCSCFSSVPAAEPAELATLGAAPNRVHEEVAKAYNESRKKAAAQFSERIKKISNPTDVEVAFYSLSNLSLTPEEKVPFLRELLQHPLRVARENALIRLGLCSLIAAQSLDDIVRILNSPESDVNIRCAAVEALSRVAPGNAHAAAEIAKQFEYPVMPPRLKRGIAQALGSMGSNALPYLPKLKECLGDADRSVTYAAFCSIGRTVEADRLPDLGAGTGAAEVLNIAMEWKRLAPPMVGAGDYTKQVTTLVSVARGADGLQYKQCLAVANLGALSSADTNALAALLDLSGSDDRFLADLAKGSLMRIPKSGPTSLLVLQNALRNPHSTVTRLAANLLRELGPDGAPAVPDLVYVLRNVNSHTPHYVIGAVLDALRAIGPAAVNSSAVLVEMLPEQNPLYRDYGAFEVHYLRGYVMATLADVGVPDDAFPFILDALANSQNPGSHLYAGAAKACTAMGVRAAAATPLLLRAMETPSGHHLISFERYFIRMSSEGKNTTGRIEAVRALGTIGIDSQPAIQALEALAGSAEDSEAGSLTPSLKLEATRALLNIRVAANRQKLNLK